MKGLIIVGILVLFITACSVNKGIVQVSKANEGENVADTTEYELITFDGKFEAWYSMNDSPAMYRSKEYYESWNKRYVTAWNIKNSQDPFFEPIVGYDYTVDYGFELNHRLFYYFQYVERVLKKTIISGAKPQVALFS